MARTKRIKDLIEKYEKTLQEASSKQFAIRPTLVRGMTAEDRANIYEKVVHIFSQLSNVNENPSKWIPQVLKEWHDNGLVVKLKDPTDVKAFFKTVSVYRRSLKNAIRDLKKKETA